MSHRTNHRGKIGFVLIAVAAASCTSPNGYTQKGKALFDQGDYDAAVLNYRKAIQRDPAFGHAYYQMGLALLKQGKLVDAYQALHRADELLGSDEVKVKLADVAFSGYMADSSKPALLFEKVQSIAQALRRKNPDSFDGLRLQGYLALASRRVPESIALLKQADRQSRMHPAVVGPLVDALFQNGQAGEAEQLSLEMLHKAKDYRSLYDHLYAFYIRTGRVVEAENLLKTKIANLPGQAEPLLQLANHYHKIQKTNAEAEALNQILRLPTSSNHDSAQLLIGDYHRAWREWPAALASYQEGIRRNPNSTVTFKKRMAAVYVQLGKLDDAIQLLHELVRSSPSDREALRMRAQLLLRARPGKLDQVLLDYQELARHDRNDAVLRYEFAQAYISNGNLAAAKIQLQEAMRLADRYIEPRLALAEINRRQGDFRATLTNANLALAIDPSNPTAKYLRAIGLAGTSSFRQAQLELTQLQKEHPDSVDIQLQLSMLDLAQKRYSQAQERIRKTIQAGRNDMRPLLVLVQSYRLQGQPDLAVQLLNQELKKSPSDNDLRVLLAAVLSSIGRFDESLHHYEQLVSRNPKSAEFRALLGQAYAWKGDTPKALEHYQGARELNRSNPVFIGALAYWQDSAGRKQEALKTYREAIALAPDNAILLNNVSYLMAENRIDLDEALGMVHKALKADPDSPYYLDTLGYIYLQKNLANSALQVFNRLARKHPGNAMVQYRLGVAHMMKGDHAKAREELRIALGKKLPPAIEEHIKDLLQRIGQQPL